MWLADCKLKLKEVTGACRIGSNSINQTIYRLLDYLANRIHWHHGQQFCSSSGISNMKAFYKTYFTGVRLRKSTHVHINCVTDRLSQTFGAMAMQTYRITPCRWFEFSVVKNSFSLLINTVTDIQIYVLSVGKHVEL